jgi:hypothetical protein
MRPVRTLAALVFAATAGMLTLHAAPAWAGPVTLHVSPNPAAAGDTVTLSGSISPISDCAGGLTLISEGFVHTHDFAGLPAVFADVTSDGTFTATTTVPRSQAAGTYTIRGRCGGGNLGALATLTVRAGPVTDPAPPTTTPAPDAPPATSPSGTEPAVAAPAVTGPPPPPATPTASQLGGRWIIPGLAALGSGALAALGVWWLYRRRPSAGPTRQGWSGMTH